MSSWLRRRFTYHENMNFPSDDDPSVLLRGYRSRPDFRSPCRQGSGYESTVDSLMASVDDRLASCSLESSMTMSEDSCTTLTEDRDDEREQREESATPPVGGPVMTYTPVLRRRRSNHTKRNYRIIPPDESLLVLQLHSASSTPSSQEKRRLLRRRSTRKELVDVGPPMVITPPVLLTRTQSCSLCNRDRISLDDMIPSSPLKTIPRADEDPARLSFVSSSTGYSSARSSLRSSDGASDDVTKERNRDSGIGGCSLSVSSSRNDDVTLSNDVTRPAPSHLDRIAIELLDTEKAYVLDLQDVIQGYLNYLVDHRDALSITLDDISLLFGCIERIFSFNSKLLAMFYKANLDCVKMSQCFVDCSGRFEDYITYCTNYHRMLSTLSSLQRNPVVSASLIERQASLGHSLPLSSYLLKPVQRILKYHLFIENMLKHLPPSTSPEDVAVVKKAHEVMTSQAARINDEKKRAEHGERVVHLQKAIQKWSVDKTSNLCSYGDLLLESSFKQAGSKSSRLLFLFEEMLLIVKQRNSNYVCKDYIMCSNLMMNESISPEDPLAFQVLSFDNPRTQYIFLASSLDQKRVWVTELKRMMLDHYAIEIPEKTKQLMLSMDNTQRVAFGRPEFAEVSVKNHKKIPKYLEKRRKSMDQSGNDVRRRSLSASRLLGTSKISLASELCPTRYRPFDLAPAFPATPLPACTCHKDVPGTSNEQAPPLSSRPPVSRTLSASTIDFGSIQMDGQPSSIDNQTKAAEVMSSRSRFHQARNRRQIQPIRHESRASVGRCLEENEISATFDELYKELLAYGEGQAGSLPSGDNTVTHQDRAGSRLDSLMGGMEANMTWRTDTKVTPLMTSYHGVAPRTIRSKSMSRLEMTGLDRNFGGSMEGQEGPALQAELRPVERRFSKLEQLKRMRSRKYTVDESTPQRLCLSDRSSGSSEGAGLPPFPSRNSQEESNLLARQRTPLTATQAEHLDTLLPSCGVVRSMIHQLENPP